MILTRIRLKKQNVLVWTGLYFVPHQLKTNFTPSITSLTITIDNNVFDVTKKKSKHYYSLLIGKKAKLPSAASKLQTKFNFSIDQLQQIFELPHKVTLEPYVQAFQFKTLNFILYTNPKLHKIGLIIPCDK